MADVVALDVRVGGPDGPLVRARGRDAWALAELIDAGEQGVTPIERPAPRWSHYIHKLRRYGVPIETIHERHGGPYSGRHGRHRLGCPIEVVREVRR